MNTPQKPIKACLALAGLTLVATACQPISNPNTPPGINDIFIGASTPGSNLGPEPGLVTLAPKLVDASRLGKDLSGEYPLICYTTDGTMPVIKEGGAGGYCFNGSLQYADYALLHCDGATETVEKTLTISYRWIANGETSVETVQVPYDLDCVEPPAGSVRFKLSGSGTMSGGSTGSVEVLGGNAIFTPRNPDDSGSEDSISYSAVVKTEAGNFSKVAASSEAIVFGKFNPVTDSSGDVPDENIGFFSDYGVDTDRSTITKCTNLGGLLNGCDQVEVGSEEPIYITNNPENPESQGPILLNLNPGEISEFSLYVVVDAPVVGEVRTITNYTLEALP